MATAIALHVLCATLIASVDAGPVVAKSEYLMDSPQHVIKTANYRGSGTAAAASSTGGRDLHVQARTAKSEEAGEIADGPLMYVVIKPAEVVVPSPKPLVKKYKADNQAIYMAGVNSRPGVGIANTTDTARTPRLSLASGAYPVFYSIAAANGKFGRNIRALTKEEISRAGRGQF